MAHWKKQKEKMVRQMAAMAWGMLVQTGKMSTEGKLTIYKALVRPHVEYGAEVVRGRKRRKCRGG